MKLKHAAQCTVNFCANNSYQATIVDKQLSVSMICICIPLYDLLQSLNSSNVAVELNINLWYKSTSNSSGKLLYNTMCIVH